MLRGTIIDFMV